MLASLHGSIGSAISLALAWLIASVLTVAGLSKLVKPMSGAEALYRFGVVRRVLPIYGVLLGVVEVSIGTVLLIAPQNRISSVAALLLVAGFVVVIASALRRGESFSCGCFSTTSDELGFHTLMRAVALLFVSILIVLVPTPPGSTAMDALLAGCLAAATIGVWTILSALMRNLRVWNEFMDKEIDWLLASELQQSQGRVVREHAQ